MTQRTNSSGKRPVFSASSVLEALGADLELIKRQDKLTYADIGAVLNKSEDQAAKYCEGTAEMGVVAFARGAREWNGRFSGSLMQLCVDSRPATGCDRARQTKVLKAALALSEALEDDEEIDAQEVKDNRAIIEAARDALDELLRKTPAKGPSIRAA
jgi:hypothetical protein